MQDAHQFLTTPGLLPHKVPTALSSHHIHNTTIHLRDEQRID